MATVIRRAGSPFWYPGQALKIGAAAGFAVLLALPCAGAAEGKVGEEAAMAGEVAPVVGAGNHWRRHFVFFPPVVSAAGAAELGLDPKDMKARSDALLGSVGGGRGRREIYAPNLRTPLPPRGWMETDFDDSDWINTQASDFAIPDQRIRYKDSTNYVLGARGADYFVPEVGLIVQRGRFVVADPAKVSKVNLSLVYRGGFVAYLNGKEIARGHLPKGEITPVTAAEVYPPEINLGPEIQSGGRTSRQTLNLMGEHRDVEKYSEYWARKERRFGPVAIDAGLLCRGINVLAVELHRSEYGAECKKQGLGFGAIGLAECHLRAAAPEGAVVKASVRPAALTVWNQHVWEPVWTTDFGNPCEPPRPIRIVAARNGAFSGKVVAGSAAPIEGLEAVASELKTANGVALPPGCVTVRYGVTNATHDKAEGLWEMGFSGVRFDGLLERPSATIAPAAARPAPVLSGLLGVPAAVAPAAVIPIWTTVRVPNNAAPGSYAGTLTVTAKGVQAVKVPIELQVSSWTLPEVKDYGSLLFIYQSPDTLERYYNVKRWSEKHWEMIEASLRLMGEGSNIGLIFPLQAESAMGNAESIIPWIKKADGSYDYDFTNFDRYLATALKYHHPDRLKVVAINVWGAENKPVRLSKETGPNGEVIKTYGDKPGTQITLTDQATGAKSKIKMPPYGTPEAEALWRPLLLQVRDRLKAKGLADRMMLGMAWDTGPGPEEVAMFRNILGDIPWFRESHFDRRAYGYDAADAAKTVLVGCNSIVWGGKVPDPLEKRLYGWRYDPKHLILNFNREGSGSMVLNGFPRPWSFHMWMESTLACGRNGNGRVGGDFFRSNYSRGSGNAGCMFGSYPVSEVGQTGLGNNTTDLFAPGPGGPITTARFENAKEGNQEAEARIVIERALLDEAHSLPKELAAACRTLLDDRTNIMRLWGVAGARCSIATAGWLDSNLRLFELADRVEKTTAGR